MHIRQAFASADLVCLCIRVEIKERPAYVLAFPQICIHGQLRFIEIVRFLFCVDSVGAL